MSVESCLSIRWKISVDSYPLTWIINDTTNFCNLAIRFLKRSVSRDISGLFCHVWTDLRLNKDLRKTISDLMLRAVSFVTQEWQPYCWDGNSLFEYIMLELDQCSSLLHHVVQFLRRITALRCLKCQYFRKNMVSGYGSNYFITLIAASLMFE